MEWWCYLVGTLQIGERERQVNTHTHSTPLFLLRLKVPKKKTLEKIEKRQQKEKKGQKPLQMKEKGFWVMLRDKQ